MLATAVGDVVTAVGDVATWVSKVATSSRQWEVNVATLDCRCPNVVLRVSSPSLSLFGLGGDMGHGNR